ncbi:DUF4238 domain-containing protein [Leptospira adleri]|uniref:DUF4238 domain-containing protein n=1 Tax=Leptospira adleri TaxID=2023186 RepID=A0A2M9YJ69_9LEPT|nr:DUF4238 domain-containing protein [Leptospira adleri]PJZ51546.1 hypothetical protein CH380_19885 [Leptospira adleri]PJZ60269.1 hypothetical protein CH376_19405 [Leptospira adleri]
MNKQPKRHHWVPQFYLEYFSLPETIGTKTPEIWCFQKGNTDQIEFTTGIHNVAVKKDLYSILSEEGKDTKLESEFSDIEGLMSQIWKTLAYGNSDFSKSSSYKKGFSLFLALMLTRHPNRLLEWDSIHKNIINLVADAHKTSSEDKLEIRNIEYEFDIKDYDLFKNQDQKDLKNSYLTQIKSHTMDLTQELLKKRWSILISEAPLFVTSDNPVLIINDRNIGINRPDTQIIFPISPARAFLLDNLISEPHWQYYPVTENQVKELNYLQWVSDIKFLLSPRPIIEVLKEILIISNNKRE